MPDERESKQSVNFDSFADSYDQWYEDPVNKKLDAQEKDLIARHLPSAYTHPSMLEVGCGTGHWSSWFAAKGFQLTGIDLSEKMISLARNKNISEAEFIHADFLHYNSDKKFHIVAAITSLEFIADYKKALEKMHELLLPGGFLIVGALNNTSYLGLKRKFFDNPNSAYKSAHFFDLWELEELLNRYGKSRVENAAINIPKKWFLPFFDFSESLGKNFLSFLGNFLVGSVVVEK